MSEAASPILSIERVRDALREVVDPELGLSIVELGLVYDIEIDNSLVRVRMTFTTPACPVGPYILQSVHQAVAVLEGVQKVEVKLTFDPPWGLEKASEEIQAKFGLLT